MIVIEVRPEDGKENSRTFTYKDKHTGVEKSGEERSQYAYLHNGGPYPQRFKLKLGKDQGAYAPGHYNLLPSNVMPGRYDGLQIRAIMELQPVPAASKSAA